MPEYDPKIREQLIKSIHRLTFWTAALFLSVAVVTVLGLLDSQRQSDEIARVATNNRTALCTFRFDLEHRYEQGKEFLKEHPDGIQGIPKETFQRSLDSQKATLESLRVLDCRDVVDAGGTAIDGDG